jgi:mannose-6-phosphate isomerase-like protein (cupin superfamily)
MPAAPPEVIVLSELSVSETAARFEGRDYGVRTSFFVTDHPPGKRVPLHVHPYEEVFIVSEGVGAFTVGESELEAGAGEVVIVPPQTPHGFANKGDVPLKVVGIHPSDHVEQTWLEDESDVDV